MDELLYFICQKFFRFPSGYSFLRNNKIPPLPCPNSHLLAVEIECGFDKKMFTLLIKKCINTLEQEIQGVIVLNEVFLLYV